MPSKLERLLNLTALLLSTERPLGADEIGALMSGYPADPASLRRTLARDKEDLREMGVTVEMVNVDVHDDRAVGYRILPEKYYLRDPDLEPDELAAVKLAMGAVRLEGLAQEEILRKLGTSNHSSAPPLASVPSPPEIAAVYTAIAERRPITFGYNSESRSVEPHRLDYQRGRWYLTGFDRTRGDRRTFRIDRLDGPITSGPPDSYERTVDAGGPRMEPWRHGDDEPMRARVRLDAQQAALSRHEFGLDSIWLDLPDGSAEVEMIVSNRRAFRSFVIGFLEHAEILEPQELRDDIVEWLKSFTS